jgi:KUP system potassium uptake protein
VTPWAVLAALGVVFGDIGTSPLYTWNEIRTHGGLHGPEDVLGVMSLLFWAITIVISGNYMSVVLWADNHGEGGTFALMGNLQAAKVPGLAAVSLLLVGGSCLLFADGLITPAISVLGAMEGITVRNPGLSDWVVPATLVILTLLFRVQYRGTASVGRLFGPITLLWFVAIGALGFAEVVQHPAILRAVDPRLALEFLARSGGHESLVVLGSVLLALTGGEALYADLGHFGRRAIRIGWYYVAFPCLLLNYFGQGARLLSGGPVLADNVFFSLVPEIAVYPMVALATGAAIIASQALITGAFSLARSAINLGLLPRVHVLHTNDRVEGQIYMPVVNWSLWAGCCALVIGFGSSSGLAAAYGLAVMGTMVSTNVGTLLLARFGWGWSWQRVAVVFGLFLTISTSLLTATLLKFFQGAWMPLMVGGALFAIMLTWSRGREALAAAYRRVDRLTVADLVATKARLTELPRAMVFLTAERVHRPTDPVPVLLLKFMDRYGALPKHLTIFNVVFEPDVPYWPHARHEVTQYGEHVVSVRMHVGYMESPDVRQALWTLRQDKAIRIHSSRWTIVMGKESLVIESGSLLWRLRASLFSLLLQTAAQAHVWFGLSGDTGLSKEVIPVRVHPRRGMEVQVRLQE